MSKNFTVQEFMDAIKQNNIPWVRGRFFRRNGFTDEVEAACVIGVGLVNLGVLNWCLDLPTFDTRAQDLHNTIHDIENFNDTYAKNWKEARDYALAKLEPFKDYVVKDISSHRYVVTPKVEVNA